MMEEKVKEYMGEKKVNMLGMGLGNEEKMKGMDLDREEDFEFVLEMGLGGEFRGEM